MKSCSISDKSRSNEGIACTLSQADLARRKQQIRRAIFSKFKTRQEIENGYVFSFEYNKRFIAKLVDHIMVENTCCPFYQFDLTLKSKNDVILKISGPQKAKEMIKEILASTDSEGSNKIGGPG